MRVPELRRLKKEDFDSQYQELVDKLAFPLNLFMEQTQSALNKGIDFQNLNREVVEVDLISTALNAPLITTKINTRLKTKIAGCHCINAQNVDLNDPSAEVTGTPFITFTENSGLMTVNKVYGLPTGVKFRLRLEVIGINI